MKDKEEEITYMTPEEYTAYRKGQMFGQLGVSAIIIALSFMLVCCRYCETHPTP